MADAQAHGETDIVRDYSILPRLVQNLDRHLVFPLLNFVEENTPEDEDITDITKLKYALLKQTNMCDFVGDLHAQIHGLSERPAEFTAQREKVMTKREKFEEETQKLLDLLGDGDVVANFRSDKEQNLKYLKENHDVTGEMVEQVYEYGQFEYSCGDYNHASELLQYYRVLSTDNEGVNAATWGKLASDILSTNWEAGLEEITKVRESIDTRLFNNPLAQLQHRTWLLHWSLFPFFNHEPAREALTDMFFSQNYINTIQTSCPWILRYLAAAVITNRSRPGSKSNLIYGNYQKQLKDLVRVVRQEGYEYTDPVTGFLKALYVDFDFEEAQKKLGEADLILRNDFFLAASADSFLDAARHLISESYCKIHQRIDIKDLSTRLGLSSDEGEKWIVNLIRDTRVDAKIDYTAGTVIMNHPPQSIYQQVIERTKGGFFRTQVLSAAVAR